MSCKETVSSDLQEMLPGSVFPLFSETQALLPPGFTPCSAIPAQWGAGLCCSLAGLDLLGPSC